MHKLQIQVLITIIALTLIANEIKLNTSKAASNIRRVPEDYPTIQAAINAASPGDTIMVAAGTYNENLFVNKSVSIVGENLTTTFIDGRRNGVVVHVAKSSSVVISGFTIQNGTDPYSGIYLYECSSVLVYNNFLKDNYYGLQLAKSNNSKIFSNIISDNANAGIYIHDGCSSNIFFENTIMDNSIGVLCTNSPQNVFYHNNFVRNINQLSIFNSPTMWDYGGEGNFWSEYDGADENLDGIGDSYYADAGDDYPLMGKFMNFTFQCDSQTYFLAIISNSTVSGFRFDNLNKKIEFYVSGSNGTVGFCRLATTTTVVQDKYVILMDDYYHPFVRNWTDGSHVYGYTAYTHNGAVQKMTISVNIIPEDGTPSSYLIPIFVGAALATIAVLVIILVKKGIKRKRF